MSQAIEWSLPDNSIVCRGVLSLPPQPQTAVFCWVFFYDLGFLSRTFTVHRTAGKGGGAVSLTSVYHFHPLQTPRHQPGDYYLVLTSAIVRRVITPFSKIPPFQKSKMSPTFHRSLGKTKVLNSSCNQFVYHFYPETILVLEERLQTW